MKGNKPIAKCIFCVLTAVLCMRCGDNLVYNEEPGQKEQAQKKERIEKAAELEVRINEMSQSLDNCTRWKHSQSSDLQAWVCIRCAKINPTDKHFCSRLYCDGSWSESSASFEEQKKALTLSLERMKAWLKAEQSQTEKSVVCCETCGYFTDIGQSQRASCKICNYSICKEAWSDESFLKCQNRINSVVENFERSCLSNSEDLALEKERCKTVTAFKKHLEEVQKQLGKCSAWNKKRTWVCTSCMKVNSSNQKRCATLYCHSCSSDEPSFEKQKEVLITSMRIIKQCLEEAQSQTSKSVGCCRICGYFTKLGGVQHASCKVCKSSLCKKDRGLGDFSVSYNYASELLKKVEKLCLPPRACGICNDINTDEEVL